MLTSAPQEVVPVKKNISRTQPHLTFVPRQNPIGPTIHGTEYYPKQQPKIPSVGFVRESCQYFPAVHPSFIYMSAPGAQKDISVNASQPIRWSTQPHVQQQLLKCSPPFFSPCLHFQIISNKWMFWTRVLLQSLSSQIKWLIYSRQQISPGCRALAHDDLLLTGCTCVRESVCTLSVCIATVRILASVCCIGVICFDKWELVYVLLY